VIAADGVPEAEVTTARTRAVQRIEELIVARVRASPLPPDARERLTAADDVLRQAVPFRTAFGRDPAVDLAELRRARDLAASAVQRLDALAAAAAQREARARELREQREERERCRERVRCCDGTTSPSCSVCREWRRSSKSAAERSR
jgi:hypothetical protein